MTPGRAATGFRGNRGRVDVGNPLPLSGPHVDRSAWLVVAIAPIVAIGLLNALYKDALFAASPAAFWAADVFHFVILPGAAAGLLATRCGLRPGDYGFVRLASRDAVFEAASVGVLVLGAFALSFHLAEKSALSLLGAAAPPFNAGPDLPKTWLPRAAMVIYLSLTAAVVEEAVFRGALWTWFSDRWRRGSAVLPYALCSAFLFGWIHSEQGLHVVAATFALGFVACLLYAVIRNLWPFVLAHFAMDVYAFW